MGVKKTIYLVRHGETEFNRLGIIQGSGVDSDLNETGQKQAELFYNRYKDIAFDKVYTSALRRTYQSVHRFIEELSIPHESLEALNEIRWGDYEGKPSNPDWKKNYWDTIEAWNTGRLDVCIANGENPIELQERQKPALSYILSKENEENVLICMHGRAMKSFLCLIMGLHLSKMELFPHQNLGLYVLEYDGTDFELIKENCSNHLKVHILKS